MSKPRLLAASGLILATVTASAALAQPAAAAVPSRPANCSAVERADGDIDVSWTAPSSDGGQAITAYRVREHGFSTPAVTTAATSRSAVWVDPLRDTTTPQSNVRAVNRAGQSQPCVATVEVAPPPPPPPPGGGALPYTSGSFYKSRVDGAGVPVDAALTAAMRDFMATYSEQAAVTWPKLNLSLTSSGHNYVHRAGDTAPVWKLVGSAGSIQGNLRLDIVRTQGIHIRDALWDTVPSGSQDRLLVVQDHVFGYTVQCADVVPDRAVRTWTASSCGVFWHTSNGLDYRNPRSDDSRNYSSRGRVIDAMQVPRAELDAAVAAGTGVGHVMHFFWVRTHEPHGFSHPMVGTESEVGGWGGEGWRLRIAPSVDLEGRGLTGACLAIARTLKEHGAYIGDNSGSATKLKVGPPGDYTGTNLSTDCMRGKVSWSDIEVIEPGWQ